MQLDRQSIEKRDFPIARRGYDPASVDAHLRALAAEVRSLADTVSDRGGQSLASSAGSQVRSILEAAESTALDIEQQASTEAHAMLEEAAADALHTREQAIAQARSYVQAVSQTTSALLARVQSMDGEVSALVDRVRGGADRLAGDLASVESGIGGLYDASSGQAVRAPAPPAAHPAQPAAPPVQPVPISDSQQSVSEPIDQEPITDQPADTEADDRDLDGARLVALNMALNGESREETERYLAQNFQLNESRQLLDEVYAAIEG